MHVYFEDPGDRIHTLIERGFLERITTGPNTQVTQIVNKKKNKCTQLTLYNYFYYNLLT